MSDRNKEPGTFGCEYSFYPSFCVKIRLHPGLKERVQKDGSEGIARSYVVGTAFAYLLQKLSTAYEKKRGAEQNYENGSEDSDWELLLDSAEDLKLLMKEKKIKTWDEENFDPVESASLYKKVPEEQDL